MSAGARRNVRAVSRLPVAGAGNGRATCGVGDVLEGNHSGRRLLLRGNDAHLKSTGYAIQLHASQGRPPVLVGSDHFRAQAVGERAAWAIFGKMETHCGGGYRAAGFVGHLHGERAGDAGSGSVNASFAPDNLYLENTDLTRRDRGER